MALESRMRPRQFWFTASYALLCAAFGVWGAYDYWVRIPRQEADIREYQQALDTVNRYSSLGAQDAMRLSAEQDAEYQAAQATLDRFAGGAPKPVAAYDRPLQLWVYMVGCGLFGTGLCVVSIVRTSSRSFRLEDDGTLRDGRVEVSPDDVTGIDMSRWMAKSIARLTLRDGSTVTLDDYKYSGMHMIVGTYAHRFDPQAWNADATPVKKGSKADSGSEGTAAGGAGDAPEAAAGSSPAPGAPDSGAKANSGGRFPSA